MLCYHAAHSALSAANLGQQWEDRLKDLKDSDVCGPGKDDFYLDEPGKANWGASKSRYEISWIWLVPQSSLKKPTQTVQNKFLMKGCELNGQSHKQGKCDGGKRFRSFRRRCKGPLFTMSGSSSGGLNKRTNNQLMKIQSSMELKPIQKSKYIIANVWLRDGLATISAIRGYKTKVGR